MIGVTETPRDPGAGLHPPAWLERVSVLKSLCYEYGVGAVGWEGEEQISAAVCRHRVPGDNRNRSRVSRASRRRPVS